MSEEYYLQDTRSFVGNDLLFWRLGGGYTTNLKEAEVFTEYWAMRQHESRWSDVPWPKDYIDAKTRPAVDMQYVDIATALEGTGIKLSEARPYRNFRSWEVSRCNSCGRFMTEIAYYSAPCDNCGCDNIP
jgi:hypothetical protein